MIIDPASGNVSNPKNSRRAASPILRPIIDVQVKTQIVDGLECPALVRTPDGKEFTVERLYGSQRDPMRENAMRYAVRIRGRTKLIWQRADGTWFVESSEKGKGL